ncbi:MAG: T9SS type A sorting domain-containing protein [candidate division WOR-3 bacterium]
MKKFLELSLIFAIPFFISGEGITGIKRLRYVDPYDVQMTSYQEWSAKTRITEGQFKIGEAYRTKFRASRLPMVDIVVYAPLYTNILDSLNLYITDLEAENYNVRVDTIRGWQASQLRNHLASLIDSQLVGAVFIGNVPIAWYEYESSEGREEFPIELYFMDLNGTWVDSDNDGLYDDHTGNKAPEIYVGRIYADPVTWGNEIWLVNNYLSKIHKYRTSGFGIPQKALAYVDDDWYSFNNCNLNLLYDTVVVVRQYNTTTAADFRQRLDDPYEWVQICSHSSPWGNTFKNTSGYAGTVFNFELWFADPPFLFLNLFQCAGTRFIEENSEGSCYIFNTTNGLLAIGSTKVGSMLNFSGFYGPLNTGITVGQAFKQWFTQYGINDVDWFYGMCIIGDPTLKPKRTGMKVISQHRNFNPILPSSNWSNPAPVDTHPETDAFVTVAIDGSRRLWCAWATGRSVTNGRTEIIASYYMNGNWAPAQIVRPYLYWDFFPSMSTDLQGNPYLTWQRAYGRNYDIFGSVYVNNQWGTEEQLSSKASNDMYPAMTRDGDGRMWVCLERWTHLNGDIYCRYFDGTTWQPMFAVTTDSANDYRPAMATDSNGIAWVTWCSERYQYNRNIYVKRYNPNTGHWEGLYRITSNPAQDQDPKIAVSGDGMIWVVWTSWRNGNTDIYESHYNGSTWSNARAVVADPNRDEHPVLVVDRDGYLWCIWQSDRTGDWEIWAKYYKNGAWGDSMVISNNLARDIFPSAVVDDSGYIWVFWQSNRRGNWDIYYSKLHSDLVEPQVTVITPNGGEIWNIGQTYTIRWIAQDNVAIDSAVIEYSTDNGNNWSYITTSFGNDSTYLWTIPPTPSTRCLVRISAFDRNANIGRDLSNATFTIYDPIAPEVSVLIPNGGEIWYWNELHQIRWNSSDNIGIDSLNIYLSIDSGLTYPYRISHFNTNDSIYNWIIPQVNSNKCLIKVLAYDHSANTGCDASDNCFTIGAVGAEEYTNLPTQFFLNFLSPNPSSVGPLLQLAIPHPTLVTMKLYDIMGKCVYSIANEILSPGYHCYDLGKQKLSAGIYFISVQTNEFSTIRKIVIMK